MTDRNIRQTRSFDSQFEIREEQRENETDLYIEGYFAVFNSMYEMFPDATESVAEGAFSDTLGGDIRCLIDHDTMYVLGRNKAGTLELREDSHGLWGRVHINPKDADAMNLYERVKRGDVDQCSFGFDILEEDTEINGEKIHWTIKKVKLYEVSICTFPAYTETSVSARKEDYEQIKKRMNDEWRSRALNRLKGDK